MGWLDGTLARPVHWWRRLFKWERSSVPPPPCPGEDDYRRGLDSLRAATAELKGRRPLPSLADIERSMQDGAKEAQKVLDAALTRR